MLRLPALWFICCLSVAAQDVKFVDRTQELKLAPSNAAACWADLNNDGWSDLVAGAIWKNNGGKSFTKTGEAGACVAADFDNDGLVDLFSWSSLKLLHNKGEFQFKAVELPELPKTVSRGACWGDFNRDGFADLLIGGYEDWNAGITWPFIVLLNQKGKSFSLAQTESRLRTRGVTACDFDRDGDCDVYLSNYRLHPNQLFVSDGKGGFADQAVPRNAIATSPGFGGGHSIGAVWGDFNNDGHFDLFAGNFAHQDGRGDQPKSRFLRNLGPAAGYKFEDKGTGGVHYQESYATPAAGDYDNDGNLDVYFTTVYGVASFGRPNHPVLFRGNGDFKVTNANASVQLPPLPPTYQAAWCDYDNDGDLDLLTAGKLFQNQGTGHQWIRLRVRGDGSVVNSSAIGVQVRVVAGDRTLARQVEAGTGEGNQNDLTLHFGLGDHSGPVSLEVFWTDGAVEKFSDVGSGKMVTVTYGEVTP